MVRLTATSQLDACTFFSSVPDFISRRFWHLHFMKNLVVGITWAIFAVPAFAEDRPALKDAKDKVSYSIALDIGMTVQKQQLEINSDVLAAGWKAGLSGAKPVRSPAAARGV